MTTKKESAESTEVAVKNTSLAAAPDFADMSDFGAGFGNADAESFAIPFLQVLQKMSPQVDEDDPKYIAGAKAGMILDTVTQRVFDGQTGIQIIPCHFKRTFIRWGGRESAEGGFKGEISVEEMKALIDSGQVKLVDGRYYWPNEDGTVNEKKNDYFADTRSHYVIYIDPETGEQCRALLSLSSSMIKASRMLLTALSNRKVDTPRGKLTPPTFMNVVRLTTQGMKNDKGTWSAAKFDIEGLVTDSALYNDAKSFHKDVDQGNVEVDHSKQGAPSESPVGDKPEDAEAF